MLSDVMRGAGIYQITNLNNGRRYVGSAVRLHKRWAQHLRQLRKGTHHSKLLMRDWIGHGEDRFRFEVLEPVKRKEHVVAVEQVFLDMLKPEYNTAPRAGSPLGVRHSDSTKQKFRAAQSRRHAGLNLTPVDQYSLRGELVARFSSLLEAEQSTPGARRRQILGVARGQRDVSHAGFIWRFSGDSIDAHAVSVSAHHLPVAQISADDGAVIAVYSTPQEAAENVPGTRAACIAARVRGEWSTHKGFRWVRADTLDPEALGCGRSPATPLPMRSIHEKKQEVAEGHRPAPAPRRVERSSRPSWDSFWCAS